jgi:predicted TIM-barrel fold metal-dependent hydrolase
MPMPPDTAAGLVDVHHHVVPGAYRAELERSGHSAVGGIPLPPWDPESMLERMGALGIEHAVVSISAPALVPVAAGRRAELARECNEELAALAKARPGRLGAFATLPLPDVDAALAEIDHALGPLGLDGVALLTNYGGRYPGDETLRPVLEELDRRRAVAHVHPNLPPEMPEARLLLPPPVLEFTFDTTRALADMIATETLERQPGIAFVLSHLGGALPFLAWRLSMLDAVPSAAHPERPRMPVREQLRGLYYDTAVAAGPENLRLAAELLGTDRILYGSDTPFAPAPFVEANTRGLEVLDAAARGAVGRENALRLLGR